MKLKVLSNIDFLQISIDETGTYPLQSIVENINTPYFQELSLSKNGNHIVEKSLVNLSYDIMFNFYGTIIDNFISFSYDQYGIKIIKLFAISVANNLSNSIKKKNFEIFEAKIFENIEKLINHEFGNYLIQVVIYNWKILYAWKIADYFENRLLELSMNKYSSNVLEKLISKLENVRMVFIIYLLII